jgi:hypothetical protein
MGEVLTIFLIIMNSSHRPPDRGIRNNEKPEDADEDALANVTSAANERNANYATNAYLVLEGRFRQLSHNHHEMIRIKDQYKSDNANLKRENEILKDENQRLFSKEIVMLQKQLEEERGKHEVSTT